VPVTTPPVGFKGIDEVARRVEEGTRVDDLTGLDTGQEVEVTVEVEVEVGVGVTVEVGVGVDVEVGVVMVTAIQFRSLGPRVWETVTVPS
jgi:hypothetical protein